MPKRSSHGSRRWIYTTVAFLLTAGAVGFWWSSLPDQKPADPQIGRNRPEATIAAEQSRTSRISPSLTPNERVPIAISGEPVVSNIAIAVRSNDVVLPVVPTPGTNRMQTNSSPVRTSALAIKHVRTTVATNMAITTNTMPFPPGYPRPVTNVLEAQIALGRSGLSSGSIDGLMGAQTRAALLAFQHTWDLPPTGELDVTTRAKLELTYPAFGTYVVGTDDLTSLQPLSPSWVGKSTQSALAHETILELVAEKHHTHPNLIRKLNQAVNWTNVAPGVLLVVPDVSYLKPDVKAAYVTISLTNRILQAFDAEGNLLAHFPCSIAQKMEKRPVGELHVESIAPNPNYTFKPELFPESAEARQIKSKLILPPGPNNPVGVAWIGLDRPGYGIHGTPLPEQVGRTESHGCFRLANWNADYLVKLVSVGMPVYVNP